MNEQNGYYVTEEARKRFRRWLFDHELTFAAFCRKAGGTRQYMDRVIKGKLKVTDNARSYFKKGGYDLL